MHKYCLAIDIGASGGRHILGWFEDGRIRFEEVYRFDNGMEYVDGSYCWNTERIFKEILAGMKKCREIGKIPYSVGIDTWGVDFVLIDREGNAVGKAVGYRDSRTAGYPSKLDGLISPQEMYERTGIQSQVYNTIYQLMSVKDREPDLLDKADMLLFTPDYYCFLLSGVKGQEYTIASTSMLLDVYKKTWDNDIIDRIGLPGKLFREIHMPGTLLGNLSGRVRETVGYDCKVVSVASHDTASAVMAVPNCDRDTLYISSGTWSLMGIESETPNCTERCRLGGFTNEGGYQGRYRILKNIMGLWMIQSVRREIGGSMSYKEICDMASKESIPSIVDCNDICFLAPESMVNEVKDYCARTGQQVPQTLGEIACVIYNSLAKCYADTLREIENITGRNYPCINIIGGGSKASYLNDLTREFTGRKVIAGPAEATAIGNIMCQMISCGELGSLEEARKCISYDL